MKLCILAVLYLVTGLCQSNDSLRSALDAVVRRQRDLEDDAHYIPTAFRYLAQHTGAGQPENIGYGFQKSGINNGGIFYAPSRTSENLEPQTNAESFERVLLEYLVNDGFGHSQNAQFRELEKKSFFREQQENENKDTNKLRNAMLNHVRQHEVEPYVDFGDDSEYLNFVLSLWRKYQQENPDDMTEEEAIRVLNHLRQRGAELLDEEEDDRNTGEPTHFRGEDHPGRVDEYLENTRDLASSNHHRMLQDQKYDSNEDKKRQLYSWNYVPATFNGNYAGVFDEEEDGPFADTPDDDDISFISSYRGHTHDPTDNESVQKEELLRQYSLENEKLKKRVTGNSEQPLSTRVFLQSALKSSSNRKRFPVTKRSLRLYSSPPLLHHGKLTNNDNFDLQKKSTNHVNTTDPRVINELNQIFSADENVKTKTQKNHYIYDESKRKKTNTDEKEFAEASKNNDTHEQSKKDAVSQNKLQSENNMESDSAVNQQDNEPIEIKKKSIDWSDYFGIDRRRKKLRPDHTHHSQNSDAMNDFSDSWPQDKTERATVNITPKNKENKMMKLYDYTLKRNYILPQPFDTRNMQNAFSKDYGKNDEGNNIERLTSNAMDKKLQHIEDMLVNQAVKYTGAHEDTADSQEIQNVKDNVISQLAAAYGLEKIRKALDEFKTIVAAQKHSTHYPENEINWESEENNNLKRLGAEDVLKAGTGKINSLDSKHSEAVGDNKVLEEPIALAQLSEGYMGGKLPDERSECVNVNKLLSECHLPDEPSANRQHTFAPLCCLKQLCYACSPILGVWPARCDSLLLEACNTDVACRDGAHHCDVSLSGQEQCSCIARYFLTE